MARSQSPPRRDRAPQAWAGALAVALLLLAGWVAAPGRAGVSQALVSLVAGLALGGLLGGIAGLVPWSRGQILLLLWLPLVPAVGRISWAVHRAVTLLPTWSRACLWGAGALLAVAVGRLVWRRSWRWVPSGPLGAALALAVAAGVLGGWLVLAQPHWLQVGAAGAWLALGLAVVATLRGPLRRPSLAVAVVAIAGASGLAALPVHYPVLRRSAAWLCVGGVVWLGTRLAPRRWPGPVAAALGVVVALTGAHLLLERVAPPAGGRAALTAFAVDTLRGWTDVDGDGHGAAFGGRDCAPGDPTRHPDAHEVPGNDVDENCLFGPAPAEPRPRDLDRLHPPPPARPGDAVLVVVDTLRADAATPARHPFFAALAAEGLYYERTWATSSFTTMSLPGLLAGLMPTTIPLDWRRPLVAYPARPVPGVTSRLQDAGYATALVGGFGAEESDYFKEWCFGHGADVLDLLPTRSTARQVAERAADAWTRMKGEPARPRFLYVHLVSVHQARIADAADYARAVGETADALAWLRREVGPGTLFVVTSDHGEEFGEHGGQAHARTLYEESVRVPLYVAGVGLPRGRVRAATSLRSVGPTLVAMLAPDRAPPGDGPYLCTAPGACRAAPAPMALEMPAIHLHGVVLGGQKLVRHVRTGALEAYDLVTDPGERHPLPSVPAPLLDELRRWEEQVLGRSDLDDFWPYRP